MLAYTVHLVGVAEPLRLTLPDDVLLKKYQGLVETDSQMTARGYVWQDEGETRLLSFEHIAYMTVRKLSADGGISGI